MCDECDWGSYDSKIDEVIEKIEDLPEKAEDFGQSAMQTLEGIQGWITSNEHITDAQMSAVDNIAQGVEKWFHDE